MLVIKLKLMCHNQCQNIPNPELKNNWALVHIKFCKWVKELFCILSTRSKGCEFGNRNVRSLVLLRLPNVVLQNLCSYCFPANLFCNVVTLLNKQIIFPVLVWVALVLSLVWTAYCSAYVPVIMWTYLALCMKCGGSVCGWFRQSSSIYAYTSAFLQCWREEKMNIL